MISSLLQAFKQKFLAMDARVRTDTNKFLGPLRWMWGASLVAACVLWLAPWVPLGMTGDLDPSWLQTLAHASNQNWLWGKEIVFTGGPLAAYLPSLPCQASPHYTGYGHAMVLAAGIIFPLVVASIFVCLCRRTPLRYATLASIMFMLGLMTSYETTFFCLPLLLLLISCRTGSCQEAKEVKASRLYGAGWHPASPSPERILTFLLIVACSFMGLAKFSWGILAGGILAIADLDYMIRNRRMPWHLAGYAGISLCLFLISGQPLVTLPALIATTLDIVSGYTEAMHTTPSNGGWIQPGIFLLGSAMLLVGSMDRQMEKPCRQWWVIPLGLLATLFMSFKAGFVRQDGHMTIAFGVLLASSASIYACNSPPRKKESMSRTLCIGAVLFAMTGTMHGVALVQHRLGTTVTRMQGIIMIARSQYQKKLDEQFSEASAVIRAQFPLPPITGTVDVFPWHQAVIFAHGMQLAPRPVFQSYSAYTPRLIDLNVEFMNGARAPDNVVFTIAPIDNRFPTLDDGPVWPILWSRYRLAETTPDFLILTRQETASRHDFLPLHQSTGSVNSWITVPPVDGLIWCQLSIDQSIFGKLLNLLYKPPLITMTVRFADNSSSQFRIVPAMARHGFLLSPLVADRNDFATVLLDGGRLLTRAADKRIVAASIDAGWIDRLAYRQTIHFTFSHLVLSSAPESSLPDPTLARLWQQIGLGYYRQQQFHMALAAFEHSLLKSPLDPTACLATAILCLHLGQFERCQNLAQKVLDHAPGNELASACLAMLEVIRHLPPVDPAAILLQTGFATTLFEAQEFGQLPAAWQRQNLSTP